MESLEKLHELLGEFTAFFDELLELEKKKIDAITANDIESLEQYMKDEQAFTMKLKGLERRREKIQAECGFAGLTLKQITDYAEGTDKEKMADAQNKLQKSTQDVKDAISCAGKCVELHLYDIERTIAQAEGKPPIAEYNGKGDIKKGEEGKKFKSKKV